MKRSRGWRQAVLAGMAAVGMAVTMAVASPAAAGAREASGLAPAAPPPTIAIGALECGSTSQTSFICVADGSVIRWHVNGVHLPAWNGQSVINESCVFQQTVVVQAFLVAGGSAVGALTCGVTPLP